MALTKANNRMIDNAAVNIKDYGAVGDGVVDDLAALKAAWDAAAATESTLYIPDGTYLLEATGSGGIIDGRSNTKVVFGQNAIWKFANTGGYAVGACLEHSTKTAITYDNIYIDANSIAGANAIGGNNSSKIVINNARVKNALRSATAGGGRGITFQFNCQDIQINSPIIWDCTTGIDFHGRQSSRLYNVNVNNPTISNCEEALSFYDLFDSNLNTTVGGDSQVNVNGGSFYNCGLADNTALHNPTPGSGADGDGTDGGIIVSERARSISISNVSIFNDPSYGKIGGIIRGSYINCNITNIKAYAEVEAVIKQMPAFNLLPVVPSVDIIQENNVFQNIHFSGSCDYVVFHDNGGGVTKASKNKYLDIYAPTPATGLLNATFGSTYDNFARFVSTANQAISEGSTIDIYNYANSFSATGTQRDTSIDDTKRGELHIKRYNELAQLKLEREGTSNTGSGALWASSVGISIGDDSFNTSLICDTEGGTLDVELPDNAHDTNRLILNGNYLWVDSTGDLRIKSSAPTSDTDGTVVGTQS